MLQSSRSRNFK